MHKATFSPYEISADLLKRTGDALLNRDFEAFAACFAFPLEMTTTGSAVVAHSRADLERKFWSLCEHYHGLGATALPREIEAVEARNADEILTTNLHRVVDGSVDLLPPYSVFAILRRIEGKWLIAKVEYLIPDTGPQGMAIRSADHSDPAALEIYQDHLDTTSAALVSGDFDAFANRISLPHRITTETDMIHVESREQMHEIFTRFHRNYSESGMTRFVRMAQSARFITPDEIIGVHMSRRMRHDKPLMLPYPNRVRLLLAEDGVWRETHCANAILNNSENFTLWTRLADRPTLPELSINPERKTK